MELLFFSVKVMFVVVPHLFPVLEYILCGLQYSEWPHVVVKSNVNHWRHCLIAAEDSVGTGFTVMRLEKGNECVKQYQLGLSCHSNFSM